MRIPAFPRHFVVQSLTILLLAASGSTVDSALAQDTATYAVQSGSKLWVDGTSSKSDFTVHAADVTGSFEVAGSGAEASPASGRISVESKKIESGKSTIMDRLMHEALMVEEHATITYELTSAEPGEASADGSMTLNTTGKLTLTGTTRDVEMAVKAARAADGTIRFTGSHPLKMSDYGMTPPTAMFGALRTGDDVTIHFDIVAAPGK